jgi:RNAse (barnase) inhibitor barstar
MTKELLLQTERDVSFSQLEYVFPVEDSDTYHNLQILREISEEEGVLQDDFSVSEDGCKVLVSSYDCVKDNNGDGCVLCSVGLQKNLRMLLYTRQMPFDGFEEFARIEPYKRVLYKEQGFSEENVIDSDGMWEMVAEQQEVGLNFTVLKNRENEQVTLRITPLDKILDPVLVKMVPRSKRRNYGFGIINGEERFVDKAEYKKLVELVTASTGKNGNFDGIRTEEVFVDVEGVGTKGGRVILSISF